MISRHGRGVSSAVAFLGAWLLTISPLLLIPSQAVADPSASIPADWFSAVQRDIAAQEYQVTWQDHTQLGDIAQAYHAPNRAQNFRTYFTPEGIRSIPRDARPDESLAWEWGLEWCAWGRDGAMQPLGEAILATNGNRVEYRRGALLEWYVNDARGLEQGFTIQDAPGVSLGPEDAESASPLRLEFKVRGNVHAVLTDACDAVDFLTPDGARAIHFSELRATDAVGSGLPSWFEVEGSWMSIVVDERGATYPITIDPLATSPSWTAESDQASAYFSYSVATAGDVNGDGFSDVIVGAYAYDNGQTDEGRAFVYQGSAAGPAATANWTTESDQANAYFGFSVATAGDVNGDGFSDVIVGAFRYGNGQSAEGRAYVYHGSATGLAATANWTAESNQVNAELGVSVATAGDVNGDGYSDVIVGAFGYDAPLYNEGLAFVYHGSATGLAASANWWAEGDQESAEFGRSVATAGDVNGDGYSDVIVGAHFYNNGQTDEGRAFVYHGSAAGLSATANWTAESDQANAIFGRSVATAGDVNGDGYSDVIVGAYQYDNGQTNEGRAFLYQGSPTGLSATANWTAESDQESAVFGYSVATAGDVNGDGYSDVIVGAYQYDNGQTDEGRAFVYQGSATGLPVVANWTAESGQEGALFGICVATAGDVNGDGFSDVIAGAPYHDNLETDEGRAFVYNGSAAGLSPAVGWAAESNQQGAKFGTSVASAGDVNGDGFSDVIVGAPEYDNGETDEGRAYVYLGSVGGLSGLASWTDESNQPGAFFGWSVATAGDVNGDGYSDVIVGAYKYDIISENLTDAGRSCLYTGSATGPPLSEEPAWTADGDQAYAYFGYSAATAGDVNGDGYSDVIFGAHYYDNGQINEGRAFVYHGSAAGLPALPNWTAESNQADAHFGCSVATAGDVDGDGYSDVIVGADSFDNPEVDEGQAFVYCGSATGLPLSGSPTSVLQSNQPNARFGISVATAGDVNGDGYSDVIVGADQYNNGQINEGRAFVYYGSAGGLSSAAAWTAESDQAEAHFGISVATAGDVNGDGYSDVIVGADQYDNGQNDEGRAFVYQGSATDLSAAANWTSESNQTGACFGHSVASAGDVNGDGYGDVIVGAYQYDNGQIDEGRAFAYFGNAGGGRAPLPRQRRTDVVTPIAPLGRSNNAFGFRINSNLLSVFGRTQLQMVYEVKPLGTLFNGASTLTEGSLDTGPDGQVDVSRLVTGLSSNTLYHWRVRARYDLAKTPFQRYGPWVHIPIQGWNESDLRTAVWSAGSEEHALVVGGLFELRGAGSNPAREACSVRLVLTHPGRVRAEILDVCGRSVADLAKDELLPAGSHDLKWDGRTRAGVRAAAGVYLVRASVDGEARVRKLVLVR